MSFARTVVKMSHMPVEMQENAIQVAQEAIRDNNTEEAIASSIKKSFENLYPAVWHCFVGRNFGCFVTHEASRFVYFYIGQVGVCLFATA